MEVSFGMVGVVVVYFEMGKGVFFNFNECFLMVSIYKVLIVVEILV